ncbi:esterase family protein [Colletotrichum tofieldiae]|uniref:Esterase family protein n=1 Tax=Colletotrichum tofieldiae TaxID=708197 RepID=A0A166PTL1_9PEZI|nr:esterase family protein [Colletotrichum tofieldiae]
MRQCAWVAVAWGLLLSSGHSYIIPHKGDKDNNDTSPNDALDVLTKRATDPANLSWIKNWAAIGDSFTAGIGAGRQLGQAFHNRDDWKCSRYDQSYPMVLNSMFGSSVSKFQYPACSGDRSEQIYKQVTEKLDTDLNLVVMTAGGNDLCLAAMITKCVILPFDGESVCDEVIKKAEENIKTILKPNIKSILLALNDKMAKDSVVVYNGYAQFFNTDKDETCVDKQRWAQSALLSKHWFSDPLPLNVALRKRFNGLVIGINDAIKEVINDVQKNGNVKYKIGFADWDRWVYEGVRGQFCDPNGEGHYPDSKQPDLQFFKGDTFLYPERTELKKKDFDPQNATEWELREYRIWEEANAKAPITKSDLYKSTLYNTPDPRAVSLHQLNPRDTPTPASCPGDNNFDAVKLLRFLGMGLPDTFGKIFHPNEQGHVTMASFAMDRLIKLRAEVLGQDASCKKFDEFHCWQAEGSKAYAHPNVLDKNYQDFCNTLQAPSHVVGWSIEKSYNQGTPDENTFKIELSEKAGSFDKDACLEAFNRIIHGCDGSDSNNPMNWKFGGKWIRGEYTYRVDIKRKNRKWPVYREPVGDCRSQYKVFAQSYFIHGGGWATADFGQDTLKKQAGKCVGSTPSAWKFWYYDEPDKDGNEWSASFNTPIWTRARCFDNDKVPNAAGGHVNVGLVGVR